jgi:phage terminase large subunit
MDKTKNPWLWVEDEYYFDSRVHQRQKTDAEYAQDLIKFIEHKPIEAIYLDPSAVSFRTELRKQGVENLFEANNEVDPGINFIRNLLWAGTLKINAKCKNVIKEFQSYVWDAKAAQRGIDKPKKENDHSLDAIRYCLFTHLFGQEGRRLSPKDIDDMYRESQGNFNQLPRFYQDDNFGMF